MKVLATGVFGMCILVLFALCYERSEKSSETERLVDLWGEDVIDIKTSSKASAQMGVRELRRYIQRNKEAGLNTVPFEVDYYSKFSYVFTTMVMVLLGLAFSTTGSNLQL